MASSSAQTEAAVRQLFSSPELNVHRHALHPIIDLVKNEVKEGFEQNGWTMSQDREQQE